MAAREKRALGRGERRRQETRAKLVRAAHQLMAEKGINATTIQEITDTADVGFGSFYNHFESKQAIVQAIIDETIESYGDALDHIAETVQKALKKASDRVKDHHHRRRNWLSSDEGIDKRFMDYTAPDMFLE